MTVGNLLADVMRCADIGTLRWNSTVVEYIHSKTPLVRKHRGRLVSVQLSTQQSNLQAGHHTMGDQEFTASEEGSVA